VNVRLVCVDRIRTPYVAQACADFRTRLRPYYAVEEVDVKAADGGNAAVAMRDECERISRHLRPDECIWLLDRNGSELTSVALAQRIRDVSHSGVPRLTLIIAGTYGATDELRARAQFVWSLSKLTFLHEWARMIVLEQLYRAAKIARNEPYHY
jgi:23S rRNA (pseudouridine1915-N3)-methyltransferase